MRTKSVFIVLLSLTLLILAGCDGIGGQDDEEPTPLPPVIETSKVVSAEGFLVPSRSVDLAFQVGGKLIELNVAEGDHVTAGQVIARLDDVDQKMSLEAAKVSLAQAEASLLQSQANLANTEVGPTDEQIAQAEAAVMRAEANLAQIMAGPSDETVNVARARVGTLQAQLRQVLSGTREEQLVASLASARKAEANLRLAQTDFDKIAYASDSDQAQPIAVALERATLDYEAALANYNTLLNGATSEEVDVSRAQVVEGQAALAQSLAGATAEEIFVAQAAVLEAEAALATAQVGPTDEQIAVAQAAVEVAQVGLEQAQVSIAQAEGTLSRTELIAPFDGIVATLNPKVGQVINAGQSILTLADLATWQVETDDLTEIDVVKVRVGQNAKVTFDSLPDMPFQGTVRRIKDRSETKAGDVTYTVIIDLQAANNTAIRWGMTAFVEIDTE